MVGADSEILNCQVRVGNSDLGYFILYSSEYADFFTLRALKSAAFLYPMDSAYLTYWGALIMTIGIGIYLLWCPVQIRRHLYWQDYADATKRTSEVIEVREVVEADLASRSSWDENQNVLGTWEILIENSAPPDTEQLKQDLRDVYTVPQEMGYRRRKVYLKEKHESVSNRMAHMPELFSQKASPALAVCLGDHYYALQIRRPIRSIIAAACLYTGGAILLTPTIDTLTRVTCLTFPQAGELCTRPIRTQVAGPICSPGAPQADLIFAQG